QEVEIKLEDEASVGRAQIAEVDAAHLAARGDRDRHHGSGAGRMAARMNLDDEIGSRGDAAKRVLTGRGSERGCDRLIGGVQPSVRVAVGEETDADRSEARLGSRFGAVAVGIDENASSN